jgi:hypothetical protein
VARHDSCVTRDQYRIDEPELGNARGKLGDLGVGMRAGVRSYGISFSIGQISIRRAIASEYIAYLLW